MKMLKFNLTVKFKPWYEKALFLNLLYQDLHNFFPPMVIKSVIGCPLSGHMPNFKFIDFINNRYYVEGIGNFLYSSILVMHKT